MHVILHITYSSIDNVFRYLKSWAKILAPWHLWQFRHARPWIHCVFSTQIHLFVYKCLLVVQHNKIGYRNLNYFVALFFLKKNSNTILNYIQVSVCLEPVVNLLLYVSGACHYNYFLYWNFWHEMLIFVKVSFFQKWKALKKEFCNSLFKSEYFFNKNYVRFIAQMFFFYRHIEKQTTDTIKDNKS